jgi:hypothetical protein
MSKPSIAPKHPRHMTTEEAVNHLFHPKVVEHLKKEKEQPVKQPHKKA